MACCGGGYPEDRFQASVDKNFFCPICTDVLKDPVQCHNEHYFCRSCITKHLKNSQTCPVCMEKLTEEALTKPARIVTGYLDGLMINCDHSERGCTELVELGCLETHISVCKYRPVTCPNERCETIVNMADLEQHISEDCEYRQVFCEECDENMSLKKYGKHGCCISKDLNAMKVALFEVQDQVKEMSNAQEEMFKAIQNLTSTVSKMSTAKRKAGATCDTKPQGDIVVVGGQNGVLMSSSWLESVEMYSLANRTWSKLAPMQQKRASPTAHFYNGQVMVTGGHCDRHNATKSIEYIQIHEELTDEIFIPAPQESSLQMPSIWEQLNLGYDHRRRPAPVRRAHQPRSLVNQLPIASVGHKTAIINDQLWMVGGHGMNQQQSSNVIYMTPIHSSGPSVVRCRMPISRSYHGLEVVHGNELLIIGGTRTGRMHDAVRTVYSYNTATNVLRQLWSLPLDMLDMATVKHGEDVIIIGGMNDDNEYLNTVFKYSYKTGVCDQLPGMKHKRGECAAVISGNKVFVMGGYNREEGYLSSVECFDLESQVWHELPSMSEAKYKIAAVLVP